MYTTRRTRSPMVIWLALMTVLALSACQFVGDSVRSLGAETPEQAILRVHEPEMVQDFTVTLSRPLPQAEHTHRLVLVYTADNPDGGEMLYHALVEKRHDLWYMVSASGFTFHDTTLSQWIDYDGNTLMSGSKQYFLVYGRSLSPEVAGVNVTFTNGDVVQGTIEHDTFLVITPHATNYCFVRAVDAQGKVLAEPHDDERHHDQRQACR